MGTTWYALGYELVWLWLRIGISLVTKRYGTKRFGYETSRNRCSHGPILFVIILAKLHGSVLIDFVFIHVQNSFKITDPCNTEITWNQHVSNGFHRDYILKVIMDKEIVQITSLMLLLLIQLIKNVHSTKHRLSLFKYFDTTL